MRLSVQLSAFAAEPNRGLIIAPTAVTFANNKLIVELAARYRLPAIYSIADYPKAGGLVSYGLDQADQFRQGAAYADRILKGAKVAELPVQYPTKFELWSISKPRRCSASRFPNLSWCASTR